MLRRIKNKFSYESPYRKHPTTKPDSSNPWQAAFGLYRILKNFNGADLFRFEDIGGLKLFNDSRIIEEDKEYKDAFSDSWDESVLLFGYEIGNGGDYYGFRIKESGEYEILDVQLIEMPSDWGVITTSLDDFLSTYLDQRGRRYWLF